MCSDAYYIYSTTIEFVIATDIGNAWRGGVSSPLLTRLEYSFECGMERVISPRVNNGAVSDGTCQFERS